jgi:PAS domain-containing protein
MDPDLVDRIYECSLVPELWPSVLDDLGRIADATGGSMFIAKSDVQFWTASPRNRDRAERMANEGWIWRGQLRARAIAARHAGFLTDRDLFTADEFDQEPLFRDLWRPQGIGWLVGTVLPIPTGENVNFLLTRRTERGPVERTVVQKLDELRPHLARSAMLSARLQLERARIASETLAALGLPALILNEQGKVLAANSLVEALTGYVHWRAQDRISLKDRSANQLLCDAITTINVEGSSVRSFPVRDLGAEAMMVAHVIPIRLSARDFFFRLRRRVCLDARHNAASAARRTRTVVVRSHARRGARRPQPRLGQNRGKHRVRWWHLVKHSPNAHPWRFGKNRLQPSGRRRRASHSDLLHAAAAPA